MNCASFRSGLVLAASCFVVACAPQTEIVKLYDDSAGGNQRFERLLVVALAADPVSRVQLEDMITAQLQDAGVMAFPAHNSTGPKTVLKRAEVDLAAEETGAEAILVTHIVSVDMAAEKQEGRVDVRAECRGGDPADYFLYDYSELKEPDTVRVAHTVVAVTNLYTVGDRKRLWTIQSTCFDRETIDEGLLGEAAAITRQLRIDRLID